MRKIVTTKIRFSPVNEKFQLIPIFLETVYIKHAVKTRSHNKQIHFLKY